MVGTRRGELMKKIASYENSLILGWMGNNMITTLIVNNFIININCIITIVKIKTLVLMTKGPTLCVDDKAKPCSCLFEAAGL